MELVFGIGALWGQVTSATPSASVGPDQFAILQDNSIDFTFEIKELYSQLGFPVDIARGKGKITGKAKTARVVGQLYADLFFGESTALGEDNVSQDELATITSGDASALAVAHAGTAFVADLGVYYNATGRFRFTYVTGAPSAVQTYTVSAAVVSISYVYTDASGKTITIHNQFMGYTPTFAATFYQSRTTLGGTGQITLRLNECVSSHLTFPSRIDDYGIPDFDFAAFSRGDNLIGTLSTTE
jgi:hypothetical protein